MSKVYVIQNIHWKNPDTKKWEPRYDLSQAEEFGELVYLLDPKDTPLSNTEENYIEKMDNQLMNFTENDHLLLIGSPVFIGAAMMLAATANTNTGIVNILQWNRGKYSTLAVDLRDYKE